MYTTNLFVIATFLFSSTFCVGGSYENTPTSTSTQSRMHHMQQKHPDRLSSDERAVYYMLSPLYQRIFLYGLDDDQREMVTVFEKRGENPYQAIDNVLKRDRKKADRSYQRDNSPRGQSKRAGQQNRYIISEREKSQRENMEPETYEEGGNEWNEEGCKGHNETQTTYREKDPSNYEDKGQSGCNSCTSQRKEIVRGNTNPPKKESAFVRRCKAYFAKNKANDQIEKNSYQGNKNWKKYEYKESLSKKSKCKCGT